MSDLRDLLSYTTVRVADYREGLAQRPVFPRDLDLDRIRRTLGSLPEHPQPAAAVVEELADLVEPALVASTGPRYFGFVTGGALEAATVCLGHRAPPRAGPGGLGHRAPRPARRATGAGGSQRGAARQHRPRAAAELT